MQTTTTKYSYLIPMRSASSWLARAAACAWLGRRSCQFVSFCNMPAVTSQWTLCPSSATWDILSVNIFFCVHSYIFGVHHFWWDFLPMWPFFLKNTTKEVVTFCLHGWCTLGVFWLPAFTNLGHECQDLLSLCREMHACIDWTRVYNLIQKSLLGNGVQTHANSKGKNPLHWKAPQGGSNPWCCIT